jgi:hypothetical protein
MTEYCAALEKVRLLHQRISLPIPGQSALRALLVKSKLGASE